MQVAIITERHQATVVPKTNIVHVRQIDGQFADCEARHKHLNRWRINRFYQRYARPLRGLSERKFRQDRYDSGDQPKAASGN